MEQNLPKLDWVNLPPGCVAKSLWAPLHDGRLLTVFSDLSQRTVILKIDVPHLRKFHKLGEKARFVITFHEVESVRANKFATSPEPVREFSDETREEQTRLLKEYQAKRPEESVGWGNFVNAFPANQWC